MTKDKNETPIAFPEMVASLRPDADGVSRWQVKEDGTTTIPSQVMGVTMGDNAREMRMIEMLRVKLSPVGAELDALSTHRSADPAVITALSDNRLKMVARDKGFDTTKVVTGYEKQTGLDLAKSGTRQAHDKAITTAIELSATAGFSKFVAGLKAGGKLEWVAECREVQKKVKKYHREASWSMNSVMPESIGETPTTVSNVWISTYARDLSKFLQGVDASGKAGEFVGKGGVRYDVANGNGAFAPLIWDTELALSERTNGNIHAKKTPRQNGKSVRYPSRMITDPQRRVFGQKKRAKGGFVVIDISGSMALDSEALDEIIANAPNATVFAYSHRPRNLTGIPNAFMLVKGGKRVSADALERIGNVGNGVDGPALDYALYYRRGSEPVIWVCDGQVTDANDQHSERLTNAVAKMVWQNGIIQVPNTAGAIEALRNISKAKVHRKFYGRTGRAVEELRRKGRR